MSVNSGRMGWGVVFLCILAAVAGSARADQVFLTNGDQVSGTVVKIEGGQLVLASEILGELTIEVDKIHTVATDANMPVLLADANEPLDAWLRADDAGVWVETEQSRQLIELGQIVTVGVLPGPVKAPFKWSGKFEAGFAGRSGNTDRSSLYSKFRVTGEDDFWKLVAYMSSLYAEQEVDGETSKTDDEIRGGGRVQRRFDGGWSAFFAGDLERDRVKDLKLRSLLTGGLGRQWIKTDQWFYETRVGFGCEYEEFEDGDRNHTTVGHLVSDLHYKVNSHVEVSQETSWLADLKANEDYRLIADSAVTIYLTNSHDWYLKSGLRNEYDNIPADDAERLDNYYYTNLGYKF